jgi:hypothetical protein
MACDMPASAAQAAIRPLPPNMASMRDSLGVCLYLRSTALVTAKLKPPMMASQSAPLCGRARAIRAS